MMGCKKYTALIAASLYEPLKQDETQALDTHLQKCVQCRREHAEMRAFVTILPKERIPFHGNLLPAIRAELQENPHQEASVFFPGWLRPAFGFACLAIPLLILGYSILPSINSDPSSFGIHNDFSAAAPVDAVITEAETLIAQRQYASALSLLEEKRADLASHPNVGEIQRVIAELEFNQLKRYPEAYAAYVKLQGEYWNTFRQHPENSARLNLLVEAKGTNYEPLYALDAAQARGGQQAIPQLEQLIASHEGKTIAWRALEVMQELALRELGFDPLQADTQLQVATLEMLREQTEHQSVLAHLNLALGDYYRHDPNNNSKALDHYREVMQSGLEQLARQAEASLTELADARR